MEEPQSGALSKEIFMNGIITFWIGFTKKKIILSLFSLSVKCLFIPIRISKLSVFPLSKKVLFPCISDITTTDGMDDEKFFIKMGPFTLIFKIPCDTYL